ncbi:hypothetical protein LUZ60_013997 [Juncus effusus]|nr:hypothetical protein LUZ60_013997 [Juncus effusus]
MYYPKPSGEAGTLPQPPVTAPPAVIGSPVNFGPERWTTDLCSCFDDVNSCCLTFWCPCVAFGRTAHIVDRGLTSCCGSASLYCCLFCCGILVCPGIFLQWIYSCIYRRNLRMGYNLPESPCCDCCVQYCCEPCSLCQMYRELQNRGFDMSIGYHENIERFARSGMQPPMVPGGMMR